MGNYFWYKKCFVDAAHVDPLPVCLTLQVKLKTSQIHNLYNFCFGFNSTIYPFLLKPIFFFHHILKSQTHFQTSNLPLSVSSFWRKKLSNSSCAIRRVVINQTISGIFFIKMLLQSSFIYSQNRYAVNV